MNPFAAGLSISSYMLSSFAGGTSGPESMYPTDAALLQMRAAGAVYAANMILGADDPGLIGRVMSG